MFIFSFIVLKEFKKTKIDFKILKPKFGFMMNNYALTIEKVLNGQVDKLIIAPMFGFAILGNYALSIQILSIMSILPSIVFQYTLSQDASGKSSSWIKKFSILSSKLMEFLLVIVNGPPERITPFIDLFSFKSLILLLEFPLASCDNVY